MRLIELANKVLNGEELTYAEGVEIINTSDEDTMLLIALADKIRQKYHGDAVDLCSIVNARSGRCPENCSFCAQSAFYKTGIAEHELLKEEELLEAARKTKQAGVNRFSIVTSGRGMGKKDDFQRILTVLKRIKEELDMKVCASLGILTFEEAQALAAVGVTRYHANVETSKSHFPNICTTHTYADKMFTIDNAKKAGIAVCSGGIMGLGETREQRVEMAFDLKAMGITSIPLNILHPVPGTKLEAMQDLEPLEILRAFAMFRFVLPKATIRTAGGRERNLRDLQAMALSGGLNGMLVGGYLTTGGRVPADDMQMIADLKRTAQ